MRQRHAALRRGHVLAVQVRTEQGHEHDEAACADQRRAEAGRGRGQDGGGAAQTQPVLGQHDQHDEQQDHRDDQLDLQQVLRVPPSPLRPNRLIRSGTYATA